MQPIDTEEAEALAPVSAAQFVYSPVYGQDNQYIAYADADSGVWLLNLGTRETRQLLARKVIGALHARFSGLSR